MVRNTCPFLGLKDDPETALNFASVGNFCHHALPVTQIKGAYQRKYCLTSDHVNCPLFQAAQPIPPPPEISATSGLLADPRKKWIAVGIPALLAGSAAFFLAWNVFGAQLIRLPIPDTGRTQQSPAEFSILGAPVAPRPFLTFTPTFTVSPTPDPSPTACVRPEGWVPYTVNPTDSLYRLSVIYGVAIEELQSVNCMGNNTLLKPGDIIFVPELSTPTPSFTPTLTPVPPTNTSAPHYSAPATSAPQHQDPPPAQPTAVPPTAVPPTAVPPTAAPAQSQPPAQQQKPPSSNPPPKQSNDSGNHSGGNHNGGSKHGNGNGKGRKGGG